MPFRPYTTEQRTEALAVLSGHGSDLQAARTELTQRWGHAPSLSTLTMWLVNDASPERQVLARNSRGSGNILPCPEEPHSEALKGIEGRKTSPLLEGLLEALGNLSNEYVVIVVGKAGRGQ